MKRARRRARRLRERLAKAFFQGVFFGLALPAVLRAALRVTLSGRLRLDRRVAALRSARRLALPWLRRPASLAASVDRLLGVLPPWGYGRCFKRSLLLLDLWSRCGLEPTLHLGVLERRGRGDETGPAVGASRAAPAGRQFHAWLTTGAGGPSTSSQGHLEIWRG